MRRWREHSDWHWWYPLDHMAGAVVLDGVNPKLKPVVPVIPSFAKIKKLGMIFEARDRSGRLLVCTIDLTGSLENEPVRRQLRRSLLAYLSKPMTDDCAALSEMELATLFQEAAAGPAGGTKPVWFKDQEPPPPNGAAN